MTYELIYVVRAAHHEGKSNCETGLFKPASSLDIERDKLLGGPDFYIVKQ